jgi:hypothetical protein
VRVGIVLQVRSRHMAGYVAGGCLWWCQGDRLVYRSTDSASIGSPFAAAHRAGSARAGRDRSTPPAVLLNHN